MRIDGRLLCVMLVVFITGLIMFFSSDDACMLHVSSIFVLAFSSCFFVQFNFYHPLCWYPPFFFLYSCAYPILNYYDKTPSFGYSCVPLQYTWFALSLLILFLCTLKLNEFNKNILNFNAERIKNLSNILICITILSSLFIMRTGFSGKDEIYESGGLVINLVFKMVYLLLLIYIFLLVDFYHKNQSPKLLWFAKFFGPIVFFSMLTGERNYMFQLILITILIMSIFDRIKTKTIFMLLPLGVILLPVSHMFKYYIATGVIFGEFELDDIVFKFLQGEFLSAGNNMQILVNNNCYNYFNGASLLNDFVRIFFNTGYSNQSWFNDSFFPNSRVQYGFTIIGEGYVNWGYFGVFLIISIICILLRYLCKNTGNSVYFTMIYVYMIPIFIYSLRADISNVFSPLIKYAILGTLLLKYLAKVRV